MTDGSSLPKHPSGLVVTDGTADQPRGLLDRIADALDSGRNEQEFGRPTYRPRGTVDRIADLIDGAKGPRRRP